MKGSIITILTLILFLNLNGQNASIHGKAVFEKSLIPIDSLKIELLDSVSNVIQVVYTDSQGLYKIDNIPSGIFELQSTKIKTQRKLIVQIIIGKSDSLEIDFRIKEACPKKHEKKCPFCASKKKVLPISPGTILSINWGDNFAAAKRYDKKIRKQGYQTYLTQDGEEEVISMYIDSEEEKFWDGCHHWFCTKCKKVF